MGCASTAPQEAHEPVAITAAFDTPPSSPAPINSAPVTAAPVIPALEVTAASAFDAQLEQLLSGKPSDLDTTHLPADEQALLSSVIESIAGFRRALKNDSSLTSSRVAPLLELSDRIRSQTPLDIPALAICKSVQQFGVFDGFDNTRIPAGKDTPAIVYCEVDHFTSRAAGDGKWETRLLYEASMYTDDEKASVVWSKKPAAIVDRCRNKRNDFFLADRITIPSQLPAGRYVLKVTIIDQFANRVAEKSIPVTVASN